MRTNWSPPEKGPSAPKPGEWRELPICLWSDGTGRFVVTGSPPPEVDEDNPKHNCDEMGCASDHVLARCADTQELGVFLSSGADGLERHRARRRGGSS